MLDFNLSEGPAVTENELDYILQQIDILFDTNKKEVLGNPEFGSKYDDYLYKLKLSAEEIQSVVEADLYNLDLLDWQISVHVDLLQGVERDIILININIYKGTLYHEKIYKIQ